jgi:hypothetical protein
MKLKLLLATLLYASISFSQVPNYVPTNGLVGWYGFNGNANDQSSNANDGTVNGATLTIDRNGNANSAYNFDGIAGYINMENPPFTNPPFTISAWVNLDVLSGIAPIVGLGEGGANLLRHLYFAPNYGVSGKPGIGTAGANGIYSNTDTVASNEWEHVVVVCNTYSTGGVSFYVNGTLLGTNSTGGTNVPLPLNNNGFTVGKHTGNPASTLSFFAGDIDDIGLWNLALSACEIEALFHSGTNPVSAGNDVTICNGESVTLNGSGASLYVWDNTVIDGQSFTPSSTNTYNVTGTSVNSCDYNDDVVVTVNETTVSAIDVTATDTYTSPSGIVYDVSGIYIDTILNAMQCDSIITINLTVEYTGMNELENTLLSVYPNPTSKILSISGLEKLKGIYGYKIVSISGTVISEIKGQSKDVNTSKLRSGIYFLNVLHEEGIETFQFIKQ